MVVVVLGVWGWGVGGGGHLVSIRKIKWFTRSLLQAVLLLGGVHAGPLHHHPVDTNIKGFKRPRGASLIKN